MLGITKGNEDVVTELRTLIAVARYGTFAAAGDRIGLTQSAVSGHVRRLEKALGFALFERTGRAAVLNAAGLRTLGRAEEIIARFDDLGEEIRDEDWQGSLHIGAIASVQGTIVARALSSFRARFPLCQVHLAPGVSLQLLDRVDTGELDLAVLIRPSFDPPAELKWTHLCHEDYALLVPASVEGNDWMEIVAREPFIQYDRGSFGGRQVERMLKTAALEPREWLEMDDIQAMVAIVEKGLGVAIAPMTEAILPLPPGVRALSLSHVLIRREIGVLARKITISDVGAAFRGCLANAIVSKGPA